LDSVSEFALFHTIVETGGISAAALALQSSPAAVSRRLSALEAKLGVRLAERSSRCVSITSLMR
jgi:LysR family transcriptional regulator, transcriptional activator for dmlA